MNRHEAKAILAAEAARLEALSYAELVSCLLDRKEAFEVHGPSGARYQVVFEGSWDDDPQGALRLVTTVHDGGWRRFLPLFEVQIREPERLASWDAGIDSAPKI